ncbi:MAG: hypothetical protein Fur0032_07850 [Terrimicrobiaceae bacterium]
MKIPVLPAVVAGLVALSGVVALAEVLIYDLDFRSTGPGVNYANFRDGYVVVDEDSLTFDSVIILDNPESGQPYYVPSLISGSYFELQPEGGGNSNAVLQSNAGSSDTAENLGFQVLGKTSSSVRVGPGVSLRVARKMRGFLLASSNETVSTDADLNVTTEYGFAGFSKVTANFDSRSTRDANNARLTTNATLDAIISTLEQRGIGPEPTPTPSPTATPTSPTPTPTATPTPTP